jgi:hypothetical protein
LGRFEIVSGFRAFWLVAIVHKILPQFIKQLEFYGAINFEHQALAKQPKLLAQAK